MIFFSHLEPFIVLKYARINVFFFSTINRATGELINSTICFITPAAPRTSLPMVIEFCTWLYLLSGCIIGAIAKSPNRRQVHPESSGNVFLMEGWRCLYWFFFRLSMTNAYVSTVGCKILRVVKFFFDKVFKW